MKLNKIEKIFVIVVILGLILVGGFFLFVMPCFTNIENANKTRDAAISEREQLNSRLARLETIDADIASTQKTAETLEGSFFPDLTTYETVESTLAFLKAAGFETHTINVVPLATRDLSLEFFKSTDINYSLKTLAKGAKDTSDEEQIVEGEFKDGSKKYFISVNSLTQAVITDENGEEIPVNKYSDTMKKLYNLAICKYAAANSKKQTVGVVQATFEITGKNSDYIELIDRIYSSDHRAMMTSEVKFPMTIDASKLDKDTILVNESGYATTNEESTEASEVIVEDDTVVTETLTLIFLSVEPMDALKTVDVEGTDIVVDQRPAVYLPDVNE